MDLKGVTGFDNHITTAVVLVCSKCGEPVSCCQHEGGIVYVRRCEKCTAEDKRVAALQTTNTDYTKCAQDIIASVMSRCSEPVASVIEGCLKAHFA